MQESRNKYEGEKLSLKISLILINLVKPNINLKIQASTEID